MNKFTKQCVAAVASLAMAGTLCVAGAVVAGSSAWADTACNNGAPWSDACKSQTGSITIKKWKYEGDNVKNTKVNAKFKVTKVTQTLESGKKENLDLTNYSDWLKVAAKVTSLNTSPKSETDITLDNNSQEKQTTDGSVKFDNLGIGLYKVEEISVDDGYEKLANPFFMTIPEVTRTGNNKDNTYKYNVEVDPKNAYTKDAITKTVNTSGMVGVEDEVPYEIKASAITTSNTPADKYTKDDFTDFAVWDDVPTDAYDAVTAAVTGVKVVTYKTDGGEETVSSSKDLTKGTDYSVEDPVVGTSSNGIGEGYSRLKIKFNDGGLTEIANQRKTSYNVKVVIALKFTLKKGITAYEVKNKYGFQQGHNNGDPAPSPTPDPEPNPNSKVTLANFQIKKVNGAKETETLGKAKFEIFANKSDADKCAADTTRATDCNGTSKAKGFKNKDNGTPGTDENNPGLTDAFKAKVGEEFYVVETQAPDGFALSPKVEKVKIVETGDAWNSNTKTFTYTFKDLPNGGPDGNGKSWFNLPKTGAAGVIIFALAGICLVAVGMFIFLRNRKKDEEQQSA